MPEANMVAKEDETAPEFSPAEFRSALGMFPTGVTVVTANSDDGPLGATVSSFNSVSLDPPLVLFSIGRHSKVFDAWNRVGHFAVNILDQSQRDISGRFGRSHGDKWEGIAPIRGEASGAYLLRGALAWFECETYRIYDGGDHIIIVGRVLAFSRKEDPSAKPLIFFGGNYRNIDDHTKIEPTPSELMWTYGW